MSEIRSDVFLPTDSLKTCTSCGQPKRFDEFSLALGVHSAKRKNICVDCETKQKKAKRYYSMTAEEMDALLRLPCYICKAKALYIDIDLQVKKPNAVICRKCWDYLKYMQATDIEGDMFLRAYNYFIIRRDFPFIARYSLHLP